jgi:hypothetical protein
MVASKRAAFLFVALRFNRRDALDLVELGSGMLPTASMERRSSGL